MDSIPRMQPCPVMFKTYSTGVTAYCCPLMVNSTLGRDCQLLQSWLTVPMVLMTWSTYWEGPTNNEVPLSTMAEQPRTHWFKLVDPTLTPLLEQNKHVRKQKSRQKAFANVFSLQLNHVVILRGERDPAKRSSEKRGVVSSKDNRGIVGEGLRVQENLELCLGDEVLLNHHVEHGDDVVLGKRLKSESQNSVNGGLSEKGGHLIGLSKGDVLHAERAVDHTVRSSHANSVGDEGSTARPSSVLNAEGLSVGNVRA